MTRDEALETIRSVIEEVVPGADLSSVPPHANFREYLEMDSLDFLNFVELLSGRTGLALPEQDYASLTTLDGCADYVAEQTRGTGGDPS
ncbi:acyl carrier protein [Streptomyces globosus]|uniref:Acyl carrier protein n=1 Tax=Streptomyces globosus TaxID=68209 RepID=A0A344U037_9ACTN|nr:acyl carrier protein [Streptomyces globosus]AXE24258.1 acyl carrier protein [Streptomyces globosus]